MNRTQHRVLALLLALAGTSMVVGDLLLFPGSRPDWYQVGLGLLFLSLMSVNHHLCQQVLALRSDSASTSERD